MARYRPVHVTLWTDRRFLSLSDQGKLLWLHFLTTPSSLSIPGVIVGGEASIAEGIGWPVEQYRKVLLELFDKGMKLRVEGRVVWLSNALKYQKPAGPKAIKGMAKIWDDIPDGHLKELIWEALKIACKSWSGLFSKLFPKHLGEGYAQLYMEGLDTGSGTGSGSGTRSGTGSGSLSERARSGSNVIPLRSWVDLDENDPKKQGIVARIGVAHAKEFAAIKTELGSTALGPSVVDRFEELRELLGSLSSLEDAEARCEHALVVRSAEARAKRTLQYFGSSMWKRANFENALAREVADVTGERSAPKKATTGLGALLEDIAELEAKEALEQQEKGTS